MILIESQIELGPRFSIINQQSKIINSFVFLERRV